MADSAVPITSGTGTNIDTRTESTNGNHRQVVTIGDPATNAGVAPVDATAGLKVDLGADNDVTVTGTVTAELSATDNAVLDNIDADLTTIIGHVDGAEALLTTIDADTSNISTKIDTIAGDTTSIQTAVELIDDAVYTDGAGTVTKGIAILGQDGTNPQAIKTDASGELQVDVLTMPTVAVTNAGITTIAGAVSGTEMQVDVITMPTTTVTATNLDIRDLTASDIVTIADIKDGAGDSVMDATNNAVKVNVVAGGAGDGSILDGANSAIKATVLDYTNSNPLAVRLTDSNGDYVAAGAGTQYTEDDAAAANPVGGMLMSVRADSLAAVTTTDGDNIALRATNKGELYTKASDSDALLTTIDADTSNISTKIDTIAGDTTAIQAALETAGGLVVNLGANNDVTVTGTVDLGATDNAVLDTIAAKDFATQTTLAAINAKLVTGTDIGDVTINNSTGAAAVNIQDGGNSITVDGTVAVTGVSTAANQTTIIGHVDGIEALLTTIDADTSNLSVVGGGTEAAAIRVTIANNSTGVLSIDDNGSTVSIDDGGGVITVDGTVAVTNSDITSIKTATELLDDTVFVDDADWTADTSKHLLVGGVTQVATTANTDGDVTPLTTNAFRELRTAIPESDLATAGTSHVKKYYTNAGAVTDGIIWSPAAGKRWYVTDLIINVSAACTVTLEDDKAGGDEAVMKFELAANSGVSHTFNTPWFSGEDAADLIVTTSAGNVYITITGYEI